MKKSTTIDMRGIKYIFSWHVAELKFGSLFVGNIKLEWIELKDIEITSLWFVNSQIPTLLTDTKQFLVVKMFFFSMKWISSPFQSLFQNHFEIWPSKSLPYTSINSLNVHNKNLSTLYPSMYNENFNKSNSSKGRLFI